MTVGTFENGQSHFLDIKIAPDCFSIFRKDSNTGFYTNFSCYKLRFYRKAWILNLVYCTSKICSPSTLKQKLKKVRKFTSWNNFRFFTVNKIIEYVQRDQEFKKYDDKSSITIWFCNPYTGLSEEQFVSSLKQKLKICLRKGSNIKFKVTYCTHK